MPTKKKWRNNFDKDKISLNFLRVTIFVLYCRNCLWFVLESFLEYSSVIDSISDSYRLLLAAFLIRVLPVEGIFEVSLAALSIHLYSSKLPLLFAPQWLYLHPHQSGSHHCQNTHVQISVFMRFFLPQWEKMLHISVL